MTGLRPLALLLCLTVGAASAKSRNSSSPGFSLPPEISYWRAKWASQRIVVTGKLADGSLHDVTGQTQFKSSNSKVAAVSKAGVVTPVADGEANIQVNAGGKKQKLHVTVNGARAQSAAFLTEVHPLLSKLGCNSGAVSRRGSRQRAGCRFRSSEAMPEADFEALTKAAGGRRINRTDPRDSLAVPQGHRRAGPPRNQGRQRGNPTFC